VGGIVGTQPRRMKGGRRCTSASGNLSMSMPSIPIIAIILITINIIVVVSLPTESHLWPSTLTLTLQTTGTLDMDDASDELDSPSSIITACEANSELSPRRRLYCLLTNYH
jgi:hypothetical protein